MMVSTTVQAVIGVLTAAAVAGGVVIYQQQHITTNVTVQQEAAPQAAPEVVYVQPEQPVRGHKMPAGDVRSLPHVPYWGGK